MDSLKDGEAKMGWRMFQGAIVLIVVYIYANEITATREPLLPQVMIGVAVAFLFTWLLAKIGDYHRALPSSWIAVGWMAFTGLCLAYLASGLLKAPPAWPGAIIMLGFTALPLLMAIFCALHHLRRLMAALPALAVAARQGSRPVSWPLVRHLR